VPSALEASASRCERAASRTPDRHTGPLVEETVTVRAHPCPQAEQVRGTSKVPVDVTS